MAAYAVAQEHSQIRDLWRHQQPDALCCSTPAWKRFASVATILRGRKTGSHQVQQERLADARAHADLVLATDQRDQQALADDIVRLLVRARGATGRQRQRHERAVLRGVALVTYGRSLRTLKRELVPGRAHLRPLTCLAALLAVCGLLAACSVTSSSTTPTPRASSGAPLASPRSSPIVLASPDGGEVILAQPTAAPPKTSGDQTLTLAGSAQGPLTLDPALVRDVESAFLARQIFRGLVSLDDTLQPQPELAERIEISGDGLR